MTETYTKEQLWALQLPALDKQWAKAVKAHFDAIAKPLDGLGSFEDIFAKIGAVQGTDRVRVEKCVLLTLCADNGIVAEGVSQSGQDVTAKVVSNMQKRRSGVGLMAEATHTDCVVADLGVNEDFAYDTWEKPKPVCLINRKIRKGSANFRKQPAMTEEEALSAIFIGMDLVKTCKAYDYDLVALGEMGIGNTTTASAVATALLGCGPETMIGRGAGLSDAGLERKRQVITEALEQYGFTNPNQSTNPETWGTGPTRDTTLRILATLGGFDILGMVGVCIGGLLYGLPVVLDGFITHAAALAAVSLFPEVREVLIASHLGKEPGCKQILDALNLTAVIHANLALGEGTGAVLMLDLLRTVSPVYTKGASFDAIRVEAYGRYS